MSNLPEGWIGVDLGFVCDIVRGITFPSSAKEAIYKDSNVCCLRTTNIQREINWSDVYFVSDEYVKRENQFVDLGDILMSMANSYELVGKVAVVREKPLYPTAFGAFLSAIRTQEGIEGQYLFHLLRTDKIQRELRQGSSQTVNIANISVKTLSTIEIPLAPLNEQNRIADKLDRLLAKVDACRERCDRIPLILKRFRQSVLAAATSGELTEDWREKYSVVEPEKSLIKEKRFKIADSDENLQLLPENWEWDALGNYAQCSRGRFSVRPRNDPAYFNGEHPFIQIGDLPSEGGWINAHKQTLNEKGLTVSKKFPKATVVIAIVGATIGNTGLLAYDMCFTDSMVGIETGNEISNRYIEFFLRHRKEDLRQISYAGGGQPNIKLEILNPYPLAVPPLEEQKEIVRRVEKLFDFADRLESRYQTARAKCDQLTPALLEKAFQGELVPQDPNDEPASVLLERIKSLRTNAEANPNKPKRRKISSGKS